MSKMKHRYLALCWTLVCLAGGAPAAFAQDYQPVPVTISRSQVNLDGKTYYVHIVLERQTIFGITQAYHVTEEDLYAANPLLKKDGLKAGSVVYVPVVSGQKAPKPTEAREKPVVTREPRTEKKEKPAAQEKPVVVNTTPEPVIDKDGFLQHTVKWFEDIYDVANAYGVTAQEIMVANGLKSSRISKRQTLRIPATDKAKESLKALLPASAVNEPEQKPAVKQQELAVVEEKPATVSVPTVTQTQTEIAPETVTVDEKKEEVVEEPAGSLLDWRIGKGTARVALILPFNASGRFSESNMDFYSGVLMALRDLEKEGVKTTLDVFDLQAGVPSRADLSRNDFILGPITTTDLTTILGVTGGRALRKSPPWWTLTKGSSRHRPPQPASTPTWRTGRLRTAPGKTRSSS